MQKQLTAIAAILLMSAASQAKADTNVIELLDDANTEGNVIELNIMGNGNSLNLSQSFAFGGYGQNLMDITIDGNNNGGPAGASFTGVALASGLQPGNLVQEGFNNSMIVDVSGTSNLFSFLQNGSQNTLQASIEGTGNQAAVQQYGQNNHVSFSQMGSNNSISISQRSF
ncbi:hypothetical protein [uncultured Cohaesibacter sp.]|uniref:hypothetical protein n=1 Tax=uncultured Cohaesibacter sp. TaxID=1002546 RepID=UPI002AAAF568|nr:hypothetical protein [uncultured Cohaesibacter sp.]